MCRCPRPGSYSEFHAHAKNLRRFLRNGRFHRILAFFQSDVGLVQEGLGLLGILLVDCHLPVSVCFYLANVPVVCGIGKCLKCTVGTLEIALADKASRFSRLPQNPLQFLEGKLLESDLVLLSRPYL